MTQTDDPIVAPPPAEIPLRDAPLVRVIAQVRFPLIIAVEQRDFVSPFQEAIRSEYSVLRHEQTQGVLVAPAGVKPVQGTAWRFSNVEGKWRVSLTPEFVALETTNYTSRADFLGRLRAVLEALDRHVEPKLADRLGIRYIDRLTGPAVDDIASLVRPGVLGIAATSAAAHAQHVLSETLFAVEDARLLARWGRLPPNVTVDPDAIEPTADASWILDLDMFTASPRPFSVDQLVESASRFAERLYTFFRWAVTDEFLRRYGGAA